MNFKRTPQELQMQYAIFGKIPRRADFVRYQASHPTVLEFDQLLAGSLEHNGREAGWSARYRAQGAMDFMFRSQDGRSVYFGGLQPSHDEAGRNYPLVAGALTSKEAVGEAWPEFAVASELFHDGLREQLALAIDNAVEMVACREFLEQQVQHQSRSGLDLDLACQVLGHYLRTTTVADFERKVGIRAGQLHAYLLAFIFFERMLDRYEGSLPVQLYPLALPQGVGEEVLGLATWLSLYRSATVNAAVLPQYFVLRGGPGGPRLLLAPRQWPRRGLDALWDGVPPPETVLDVNDTTAPWAKDLAFAEASYVLSRQMADPNLNLLQLRDLVTRLVGQL
ncbi:type VI secretion system-associated protein TagF [Chitinibacteraceae bacterium HSL-7]